ncbi:19792_t:CDS:2 [Funneliformis geosporum]|uniref:2063_t:CDS:1 n=1 Tax=Funneliformis geosporum TaxID=1117311 RepID=A0A9W4WP34_9GLOM|nr:2063_t:CDS:2 [Funneliformis geosporum]CAI2178276.1 19792_t:CDS:2 [Funneliformis geosporum]
MKSYTQSLFFTGIFTLIFFTIIVSAAPYQRCREEGHVEFFPDFNKDSLFGLITFYQHKHENKVIVDGIFATDIGVEGIKTSDGKSRYTAELYNENEEMIFDLTSPVFDNAIQLVTTEKQLTNLQICGDEGVIA